MNKIKLNIGSSFFIVIFVTLCLVTFSVLAYVSAKANTALIEKNIAQIEQKYELSNAAYQKIKEHMGMEGDYEFTIENESKKLEASITYHKDATYNIHSWTISSMNSWQGQNEIVLY